MSRTLLWQGTKLGLVVALWSGLVLWAGAAEQGKKGPGKKGAAVTQPREPYSPGMNEQRIENALRAPTSVEFFETPLKDVLDFLRDHHQIQINLDTKNVEDVGVSSDTPITRTLDNVSLASALNLILRDLELTWTVKDEVLLITTPEQAQREEFLITKLYDVADLVVVRDEAGELGDDYDSLIELLTTQVRPNTWDNVGGPASVCPAPFGGAKALVVTQDYQVHRAIEKLLKDLRELAAKSPDKKPPLRPLPKPKPAVEKPVDLEKAPFEIYRPKPKPAAEKPEKPEKPQKPEKPSPKGTGEMGRMGGMGGGSFSVPQPR